MVPAVAGPAAPSDLGSIVVFYSSQSCENPEWSRRSWAVGWMLPPRASWRRVCGIVVVQVLLLNTTTPVSLVGPDNRISSPSQSITTYLLSPSRHIVKDWTNSNGLYATAPSLELAGRVAFPASSRTGCDNCGRAGDRSRAGLNRKIIGDPKWKPNRNGIQESTVSRYSNKGEP